MKVVKKVLNGISAFFQVVVYFMFCRLLLTIQFWKGIPSFENWCKYPELIKETYRNMFVLIISFVVYLPLRLVMSWYMAWACMVLFTIIIYLINVIVAKHKIKNLTDDEREILGLTKKRKS